LAKIVELAPEAALQAEDVRLDLSGAKREGDYWRINPRQKIATKDAYSGPLEVRTVARTDGTNIRLHAYRSARVIFNWENNPRELRVHRPENTDPERASVATAQVVPLEPGKWYAFTWRIDEKGMTVSVDGKQVFEERGKYDLSARAPVAISGGQPPGPESVVDVKAFTVVKLGRWAAPW